MDFLEKSRYCNLIQENGQVAWHPVDPNIISGDGRIVLPEHYNFVDYNDPYRDQILYENDQQRTMYYPDENEKYYSPTDKRIWDEQYNIPTYQKPVYKVPYTPPVTTTTTKTENKKTQTEFELEEFVKKPEVMGVGALIALILIFKFI